MKTRKFIPLLVIIAAGLLAYHNSFTGEFVLDDLPSIRDNTAIHRLWPISDALRDALSPPHGDGTTVEGRPLITLSLAVNYALGRREVRGYHVLNLTIHILAGLILLGIVRRTLLQPRLCERFGAVANELALATALLWTVHPLQTESVTYIVQRAESMMGLFYLLTLYCFIRGAELPRPRPWYALCLGACALGMACKEVMVSVPLMVMLYDRTFLAGSFRDAWRRRWPLYLALASTWIPLGYLVVVSAGGHGRAAGLGTGVAWHAYALTQVQAIAHYLRLCAWPHPLVFDYGTGLAHGVGEVVPGALVVAAVVGGTLVALRRWPAVGFLGAWFLAILAPTSSVLPVATQTMAEHRMYLPLAAVIVLGVSGGYAWLGRRSLAVCGVLAIVLAFVTSQRNEDYRSQLSIWSDTVAKRPDNARAHSNFGMALSEAGRTSEAVGHWEQALRLKPSYAEAHYNLGRTLAHAGKFEEAIGRYNQALRFKPDFAEAYNNLGIALLQLGRVQEAVGHYEQALRLKPNLAEAHNNLGIALLRLGKLPEAMAHWEQALRINPDYPDAHNNLATMLERTGKAQEAIGHYEQALRLKPDYADAHNNLATALVRTGKVPEAIGHYEQALRIKPDDAEVHNNLGIALGQAGRTPEAMAHYQQALRIRPDYAEAHYNLANALLQTDRIQEAIDHYEAMLRIEPGSARGHNNLGTALFRVGRVQDAIRHFEQALRIKPDYTGAQNNLAHAQSAQ